MNIQSAAKYMQQGYRIRRAIWDGVYIEGTWKFGPFNNQIEPLQLEDVLADDWEILIDGIISQFPIKYSD